MRKILFLVLIVGLFITAGCSTQKVSPQKAGEAEQLSTMQRARKAHPTPEVKNFLTREAVVKWMDTMDKPGKIFYIYVMSDTGSITNYFVAEYRPVSVNTYLTPTKKVKWSHNAGGVVYPANALDGTYYGEGGASDQYFFFDAETGAYIELKGMNYIVSDQPFDVDAPKITIKGDK